jgi:murein DD-endopeptidase MepM/ murein hydrolase activator NlpD
LASGPDDVSSADQVSTSGFEVSIDSVDQLSGLTAVVSGDGDRVNLRADAAHDAEVIATVPDGTVVTLRVDMLDTVYDPDGVTRWWPVAVGGQEGWMTGAFLVAPGAETPVEEPAAAEAPVEDAPVPDAPAEPAAAPSGVAYDYTGAMVATISADGDGVNMRSEPDAGSAVVAALNDGTVVDLRIDQVDTVYDAAGTRWWPVAADGAEGWVSGFYLVDSNQPAAPASDGEALVPAADAETPAPQEGAFVVGDFGEVRTASGDGATLRAEGNPEADETGFVPEQGLVEILSGPASFTNSENGWFEVRWDQITGFIDGDLLIPADAPLPARTPTPAAAASVTFGIGDYASVDAGGDTGVNVRTDPGTGSDRVGFLNEGDVISITAAPEADDEGDAWYRVTDGQQSGWVAANLLVPAEKPAAEAPAPAEAAESSATGFSLPVDSYRFTQDYGCSNLGFYSYDPAWGCAIHDGVDLAAPSGTPIKAVGAGTVVAAAWCDCGLGYYVEIDHGDGTHSVYGHMASQPTVATGQTVNQGDLIGQVGSTGLSTGPHLHFMIRQDGATQDPKSYLPPLGG